MGYNIVSVNIGIMASPIVGGVLYDHAGYYSIFVVIAVLIGLDVLLRIVLVEKRTAAEWMEEDIHTGENAPTQYGTFEPASPGPSQPVIHFKNGSSSERRERSSPTQSNAGSGANTPTQPENRGEYLQGRASKRSLLPTPQKARLLSVTRGPVSQVLAKTNPPSLELWSQYQLGRANKRNLPSTR